MNIKRLNITRLILSLIVAVFCFTLGTHFVKADNNGVTLDNAKEQDILIIVQDISDISSVVIKSPSGKIYTDKDFYDSLNFTNQAMFFIEKAEKGQWTVTDKNAVYSISATLFQWKKGLSLTCDVEKFDDYSECRVSGTLSTNLSDVNNGTVYFFAGNRDGGIFASSYSLGNLTAYSWPYDYSRTLYFNELPDGTYYIKVAALAFSDDQTTAYYAYKDNNSDSVKISGNTQKGDGKKLSTVYNVSDGIVEVDASKIEGTTGKGRVSVITKTETLTAELQNNKCSFNLGNFDANDTIKIQYLANGSDSKYIYAEKELKAPGEAFSIGDIEGRNVVLEYDVAENTVADIFVNRKFESVILSGKGELSLVFKPGSVNEISVRWSEDEYSRYQTSFNVEIENSDILISLFGVGDSIVTKEDTVILSGTVKGAESLEVDGESVRLAQDGSFTAEINVEGKDNIIFTATDENDNTAERVVPVKLLSGGKVVEASFKDYFPVVISVILSIVFVLILLICSMLSVNRFERRNGDEGKLVKRILVRVISAVRACLLMLVIVSLVVMLTYLYKYHMLSASLSGAGLAATLENASVNAVYSMMKQQKVLFNDFIMWAIVAGVFFVAYIVMLIIDARRGKRVKYVESDEE